MNVELVKGLVNITTIICICFTVIFCFKYYLQYKYHRDFEEIFDMLADIKSEVFKREKRENDKGREDSI